MLEIWRGGQIGERCVAVGGLVFLPVREEKLGPGVYVPELFQIRSVGTETVHFKDHDDVRKEFCYITRDSCLERCRTLYNIFTMKSLADYPGV
jgi:hypothetical protein